MTPARWYGPSSFPLELAQILDPLIDEHAHLLPSWVHELCIKYEPTCENCAEVSSEYEYRRAHLVIAGNFLKADAQERWQGIRHEFLHVPLHPLTDWTTDLIHRLAGDDTRLRDWLISEWRERYEGAVCDLEESFRMGVSAQARP